MRGLRPRAGWKPALPARSRTPDVDPENPEAVSANFRRPCPQPATSTASTGTGGSSRTPDVDHNVRNHDATPSTPVFLSLVGDAEIVEARAGRASLRRLPLGGVVKHLAHRHGPAGDQWTALAMADGTLHWLSWSTLQVVETLGAELPFGVRQCLSVRDPSRSAMLSVVGLTDAGQLFVTRQREVRLHEVGPIDRLALDAFDHLLFCLRGDRVEAFRNPARPAVAPSVRVASLKGSLLVGAFKELVVELENDGSIPLRTIRARLTGEDLVESSRSQSRSRLLPGKTVRLALSTRALASGSSVPVTLEVELEDEAGPPSRRLRFDCNVQAEGP